MSENEQTSMGPHDELKVSSDVCEEAGLADEAKFIQAMADGQSKAYVVVERGFEYNDEIYGLNDEVSPQQVFLDKTSALRAAEQRNANHLRDFNPMAFCYGLEEITSLSPAALEQKIQEILGIAGFHMPGEDDEHAWELEGVFPDNTTDEQLREIFRLFDKLRFFDVIESDLSL